MTADDYSDAFEFRIAAYDQSYQADVVDITAELKRLRLSITLLADVTGSHSTEKEIDELFA